MQVDKDFTYQVINELRNVAMGKHRGDYDRTLMLGAANVMESNIRAYLDIATEPAVQVDAKQPCRLCSAAKLLGYSYCNSCGSNLRAT
jgi:hypothetical protein